MSKFVSIKTTLTDEALLKLSIESLGYEILKNKRLRTLLNVHYDVDIAVKTSFGVCGFIKSSEGVFELAGDDTILDRNKDFINELTQKYAYAKITSEAKKAGFQIVKEQNTENKEIRLVFRKWND